MGVSKPMVNFDSDSTITTPPVDVLKILMLQRREDVFSAIESYKRDQTKGIESGTAHINSRLWGLWMQIEPSYKKNKSSQEYEDLKIQVESNDINELIKAIYNINAYLYEKQATRWDTKKTYDGSRSEIENRMKGL
jgi:hypothetical protein